MVRCDLSWRAGLAAEREHLQALSAAYYSGSAGTSDAAFDALKTAYQHDVSLVAGQGDGGAALSLDDTVGAPVAGGAKAEHSAARGGRLLSLAAVHSAAEVRTWWARHVEAHFGGGLQAVEVAVEPKVDGLTLRASYEDGVCVQVRPPAHAAPVRACCLLRGVLRPPPPARPRPPVACTRPHHHMHRRLLVSCRPRGTAGPPPHLWPLAFTNISAQADCSGWALFCAAADFLVSHKMGRTLPAAPFGSSSSPMQTDSAGLARRARFTGSRATVSIHSRRRSSSAVLRVALVCFNSTCV